MADKPIRCFLGMGLAEADRAGVASLQQSLRGLAWAEDVRWVAVRNWHVTLAFLGDRSLSWLEAVRADLAALSPATVTDVAIPATGLRVGCFPDAKGSVVALELQPEPPLLLLKTHLDSLLQRQGYEPETRTYRPHITLGRFERGRHGTVPPIPFTATLTFSRLTLFQSVPTPQGSEYQPVWSLPLEALLGAGSIGPSAT